MAHYEGLGSLKLAINRQRSTNEKLTCESRSSPPVVTSGAGYHRPISECLMCHLITAQLAAEGYTRYLNRTKLRSLGR